MLIVMFYHSLVSDWNHGNAHFLRGIVSELLSRGHDVRVYEPADAWSLKNLLQEHGKTAVARFHLAYPHLRSTRYHVKELDVDRALDDADLVIVHEWNEPSLVSQIGKHRAQTRNYRLLFHDTHHRSITDENMADFDLDNYDGVLAFGSVIRDLYLARGWAGKAWTWHEAADTRVFYPRRDRELEGDVVWIGNWGDDERTAELDEYLFTPIQKLGLRAAVHGVRYPREALRRLSTAGIPYRGWLPNFDVPQVFGMFRSTVHIPRRPYVRALPGIPTIRVFEALACGIPLVSAPWNDCEALFSPGNDFLIAPSGREMQRHLRDVVNDSNLARELSEHGLRTILARHTCAHRVDELLAIYTEMEGA